MSHGTHGTVDRAMAGLLTTWSNYLHISYIYFVVELHPDIFAANINQDHIHQTVKWQQTYKTGKRFQKGMKFGFQLF